MPRLPLSRKPALPVRPVVRISIDCHNDTNVSAWTLTPEDTRNAKTFARTIGGFVRQTLVERLAPADTGLNEVYAVTVNFGATLIAPAGGKKRKR